MTTTDPGESRFHTRPYCPEDEFLIRCMKRGLRMLIRGAAATLLMPIEMLQDLRRGRAIGWRTILAWLLSGLFYIGCAEIWMTAGRPALPAQRLVLSFCLAAVAVAVWFNGSRAANPHAMAYAGGGWAFGIHHHDHHHGHGRHFHRGWGEHHGVDHGTRGNTSSPAPSNTRTAVCCGDCRRCTEEICLKTGLAKKKAAA